MEQEARRYLVALELGRAIQVVGQATLAQWFMDAVSLGYSRDAGRLFAQLDREQFSAERWFELETFAAWAHSN